MMVQYKEKRRFHPSWYPNRGNGTLLSYPVDILLKDIATAGRYKRPLQVSISSQWNCYKFYHKSSWVKRRIWLNH